MELNKLQELFLTRYELQLQKLEYEESNNQKAKLNLTNQRLQTVESLIKNQMSNIIEEMRRQGSSLR